MGVLPPGEPGLGEPLCNPGQAGKGAPPTVDVERVFGARRSRVSANTGPGSTKVQHMKKMMTVFALASVGATLFTACSRDMDAQQIEQRYGVSGAYAETIATSDGPLKGTLVPITLADGRQGQLFIPQKQTTRAIYLRDEQGLHPVMLSDNASRDELTRSPGIVERRAEPRRANKRSWEQEVLIIGGSAGAGTAIGALAGGKKGAGVGAAAGGIGGLIYDLATRNKD